MKITRLLLAGILSFFPLLASATPSFVQTAFQNTSCSSCTLAFNPTNSGDTIVVLVTNATDSGTDNLSSATWNGGAVSPTDKVVTGTIGGGDCISPAIAPSYEFVIQNVSAGSQNFVVNWTGGAKGTSISITEYTGVALSGQPATHTFICQISNATLTATVASGDMLVSGGGIFAAFPSSCPGGWNFRTQTTCTNVTNQSFLADVVATTTAVSETWQGATTKTSLFLISLAQNVVTAGAPSAEDFQFNL